MGASSKGRALNYEPIAFILIIGIQLVVLFMVCGIIPIKEQHVIVTDDTSARTSDDADQKDVTISKSFFGRTKYGEDIHKYTFVNKNNVELSVLNIGGIITSIRVPCRHGHMRDIIVGFDNVTEYVEGGNRPYFGAIIGRVANRISNSTFTIDRITYKLNNNDGDHHLHGGRHGWDKKVWHVQQHADHIVLSHISADGDEGYPGEVMAKVTYQLTNQNEVVINMTAKTTKKTPINLTSHPFFNLGGERDNVTILDHEVTLYADRYVVTDEELIPTGQIASVCCTLYDMRTPLVLGDRIYNVSGGPMPGYDNTWVLRGPTGRKLAARVRHPDSGRVMEVYTNQPGIQLYTGNFLDVPCGKKCHKYGQHSAFCLETQNFPDAINNQEWVHQMGENHEQMHKQAFPDSVLRPGSTYMHQVWYKFSTD